MLETVLEPRTAEPVASFHERQLAAYRFMLRARLLDDKLPRFTAPAKSTAGFFSDAGRKP